MIGTALRAVGHIANQALQIAWPSHDYDHRILDDAEPSTTYGYEPALCDDELVAVRQLVEERFGDQTGPAAPTPAVASPAAVSEAPPSPAAGPSPIAIETLLIRHRYSEADHNSIGSEDHCRCGLRPCGIYEWEQHTAQVITKALTAQPN